MPAAPSSACPRPRPASGVRCPVSGASDQCPRLPVHGTAVQCPVRASERPGVRCPASGVGVRCLCVAASAVSGRSEVLERGGGQAAVRLGWPGSAWSPAMSMTARRLPEVGAWRSKLAQAVLGQPRRRFGPGRRRGRWLGSGQLDRVADQDRPGARQDRSLVGAGCAARLAFCGRLIGMRRANRSAGLAG